MRVSEFSAIRILASSPDSIQTDGCCSRSRILVRTGCLVIDEPLMPKEVDDIDRMSSSSSTTSTGMGCAYGYTNNFTNSTCRLEIRSECGRHFVAI